MQSLRTPVIPLKIKLIDEDPFKDIWTQIFDYLPQKDLACVSLTCKKWKYYASTNVVWKKFLPDELSNEELAKIINFKDYFKIKFMEGLEKKIDENKNKLFKQHEEEFVKPVKSVGG